MAAANWVAVVVSVSLCIFGVVRYGFGTGRQVICCLAAFVVVAPFLPSAGENLGVW